MSGELEAAGALATAGVVGAAIEGREGGPEGAGNCANCDALVTGHYCSNCGQHAQPHRKLTSIAGEFLNGLWHLDTKTWRTVPMVLFRPGTLTRNYVYGKRARYLSPLTMFLFSIFLMFFAFSTIEAPMNVRDDAVQATTEDLVDARRELAEAQAELERVRANPDPDEPEGLEAGLAEGAVRIAESQVERLQRQLAEQEVRAEQEAREAATAEAALEGAQPSTDQASPAPPTTAPATTTAETGAAPDAETPATASSERGEARYETWQDGMRAAARDDDFNVNMGNRTLNERVRRKFENPDLALYQVQDAASKFSFLLAPLSLPFIALLFLWKRGVTLYDHMAYALYALAFAALLFSVVVLIGKLPTVGWAASWLLLALPVHMYFHLGGAYALGRWSALWRTCFMLIFATIVGTIFLVLVIVLGLAG